MKKIAMAMVLFCVCVLVFVPAYAADWGIYGKSSYMDWTEHCSLFKRDPLREFSQIYSLGVKALSRPTENVFSQFELEGFGGSPNYQGEHLSNQTPYNTNGYRLGATAEETLGYKIRIRKDFYVSPFASLGFSMWWREVCGEAWYTGYGRIGVRADKGVFFARAGVLIPLYTEVHGGFQNIPWLNNGREIGFETNPKGIPTPFAEIGIKRGRTTLSFSYELKKWKQSDRVSLGGGSYAFQPATTQSMVSIKIGCSF